MNTSVKSYSPDQVSLSLAGAGQITGFASGSFVTIEMEANDWSHKVGADGEVARARSNNRVGIVKIKLLQTSLSNQMLSGIRNLGLADPAGAADVGTFQLTDLSGATVASGPKAWIRKPAPVERGVEV